MPSTLSRGIHGSGVPINITILQVTHLQRQTSQCCLHCGAQLGKFRQMAGAMFCSAEHEASYRREMQARIAGRLESLAAALRQSYAERRATLLEQAQTNEPATGLAAVPENRALVHQPKPRGLRLLAADGVS